MKNNLSSNKPGNTKIKDFNFGNVVNQGHSDTVNRYVYFLRNGIYIGNIMCLLRYNRIFGDKENSLESIKE